MYITKMDYGLRKKKIYGIIGYGLAVTYYLLYEIRLLLPLPNLNMQSLFPSAAARAAQGNNALVQFPAGKCVLTQLSTGKYQVSADMRRGQIQLVKGSDNILHFKWIILSNGKAEDDRMVFSGTDCKFKKVNTGRESDSKDRVYMLKFASDRIPLMFWMQDPDTSKDEEVVKKVISLLANPAAAAASGAAAPATTGSAALNDLMQQMLNQHAPSASSAAVALPVAPSSSAASAPFGNLDLSSLLGNIQRPGSSTTAAAQQPFRQRVPATPALSDIITGEDIVRSGILDDPAVRAELMQHLPESQRTDEHLRRTVRSAQLQQSLGSLTAALRNPDNFQSVMSNFQLNPADGNDQIVRGDGVGAFLAALQAVADRQRNNANNSNEEKKEMDESE